MCSPTGCTTNTTFDFAMHLVSIAAMDSVLPIRLSVRKEIKKILPVEDVKMYLESATESGTHFLCHSQQLCRGFFSPRNWPSRHCKQPTQAEKRTNHKNVTKHRPRSETSMVSTIMRVRLFHILSRSLCLLLCLCLLPFQRLSGQSNLTPQGAIDVVFRGGDGQCYYRRK